MKASKRGTSKSLSNKKSEARKGRPPTLDRAKREVILALISVGCTRTYAARYLGVSPQTILNTAARDEAFALKIEQAAANLQVDHLQTVAVASRRTWQASAWVLERLAPQKFANPQSRTARRQVVRQFKKLIYKILDQEVNEPELQARLEQRIHQAYLDLF